MIKHVYLFRLKDPARAPEVIARIRTLKEHIPEIYFLEAAADFKGAANSYDVIEVCTFLTEEDYKIFGAHPYHEEIQQYLAGVQEQSVKIDYYGERSDSF